MPEQPTLSIQASVAPQVAGGLHALAEKHLTAARPAERGRTGDVITNTFSGTSHDTVIQIGRVYDGINDHRGR